MENEDLIPADIFCSHYQVSYAFISQLNASGLVQLTSIEEKSFLPVSELQKVEQLLRMHYDLDINLEGLEAITHLLDRVKQLQGEVLLLKNRLRKYESID
jgi:hypothetical protein